MIYLDRTFCVSPNCVNECERKLTPEIRAAANKWMKDAPIAVAYFCGPKEDKEFYTGDARED